MATFIVMLGPPGVGKGTQAKILSEKTGLAHISSGDLFRENLKNQTELGKLAQTYMTKGELVPDDVTIAMIKDRLTRPDCEAGAVLDGFPRTPAQAEALEIDAPGFQWTGGCCALYHCRRRCPDRTIKWSLDLPCKWVMFSMRRRTRRRTIKSVISMDRNFINVMTIKPKL